MEHTISIVRPALAVLGIAMLLATAFTAGSASISSVFAILALFLFIGAAVAAAIETRPLRTGIHGFLPIRGSKRAWRISVLITAVGAVLISGTWFQPGTVLAGGDEAPPLGSAYLGRLFSAWAWNGSSIGAPNRIASNLPAAGVFILTHALGLSVGTYQRVWITMAFAAAAVAVLPLAKMLGIGPKAAVIVSAGAMLNPALITKVNPTFSIVILLMAALPAVVLAVARERIRWQAGMIMFILAVPLISIVYANPALEFMVVVPLFAAVLASRWLGGPAAFRRAFRFTLASGLMVLIASAYWLVPSLLQLRVVSTGLLSSPTSWLWTQGRATIANTFWLNAIWGWKFTQYVPFAASYSRFPLSILRYGLPLTGLAGLALPARHLRAGISAIRIRVIALTALMALFVVALATSIHFPGSLIFNRLYSLPYGWLLQSPYRFLPTAGLLFALMVGFVADAAFDGALRWQTVDILRARPSRRIVSGAVLCGLVVLIPGYPLLTGQVIRGASSKLPSEHVVVPNYWPEMGHIIDKEKVGGAVLMLPTDQFYQVGYSWGYHGAEAWITNLLSRPVLNPVTQGYRPAAAPLEATVAGVTTSLLAHDYQLTQDYLTALRTPLVLVRGDVLVPTTGNPVYAWQLYSALDHDPYARLVAKRGRLRLYESTEPSRLALSQAKSYVTLHGTYSPQEFNLLPAGTAIVEHAPILGQPQITAIPAPSSWHAERNTLSTWVDTPYGWNYQLIKGAAHHSLAPLASLTTVSPGLSATVDRSSSNASRQVIQLSVALGSRALVSHSVDNDGWGKVYNCGAARSQTQLSASVVDGYGNAAGIQLSAAVAGRACVKQQVVASKKGAGEYVLSFWARRVMGARPKVQLWVSHEGFIYNSALSASGNWTFYQFTVHLAKGARGNLRLYAIRTASASKSVEQYSLITLRPIKGANPQEMYVVGSPTTTSALTPSLYVLGVGAGEGWRAAKPARPVAVDGILQGWLVRYGAPAPRPVYVYQRYIQYAYLVSMVAGSVLLTLLVMEVWRRRKQRRPPLIVEETTGLSGELKTF
ncbi:MAG: alpha-(1-_3)-arabinofuranosyltransferase family protein [Acidimicrobiales bacterium]